MTPVNVLKVDKPTLLINWFLMLLLLGSGFISMVDSLNMMALFFTGASLLACVIMVLQIEDPVLRTIILVALSVRVGLALIQAYTNINLPGAGVDSARFERYGWQNAQFWLHGEGNSVVKGAYSYSAWIGVIYSFFGRIPIIPQLINVYISLLTLLLIYKTTYLVTVSSRVSRIATLLLAVIPSLNAFSAILLRETMIIFFIMISFYYLVRWMQQGQIIFLGWSFLALVAAGMMHGVIILLLWVYLFMICFFSPREKRFRLMPWQLLPAGVIVFLTFILLGEYITYQLPINLADIITPDFIRGVIEGKSLGRSSYLQGTLPYSYFDLIWQTPLRILYFLFAPFPWLIRTVQDIFGFFDVVLYTVLLYYCYQGVKRLWSGKKHIVLSALLIATSLVVMFAWGTTNYGTAWRHRQKIAPFVIVIAAVGLAGSSRWKRLFPEEVGSGFDSYPGAGSNYAVWIGDKL